MDGMDSPASRFYWLKILFPLVFLLGLNVQPVDQMGAELLVKARIEEKDDQPQLAAIRLHTMIERQPWRTDLWERAGLNESAAGNEEKAIRDLESAEVVVGLSLNGLVELASAYERAGRYADAARLWEAAALDHPDTEIWAHLAQNQRKAGQVELSTQALRQWQALEPTNAAVAYTLGLQLALDKPDESLSQLNEAARFDPRYANALDVLQRAQALAELNPDNGYRLTVVGRGLANLGEWDLAERALLEATAINPTYAEAWALLGEARSQLGQDGRTELEKALVINPQSVLARALMALYWGRQEQWDKAIAQLEAAARLEPDRAVWRVELGNLHAQQGDLVQAMAEFRTAIDLEPKSPQIWRALASFCLMYEVELEKTGLPAAREAMALDDQDARAYDLAGAILVALEQPDEGKKLLLQALNLDENLADAHLHLGSLYLQQLLMDQAEKELNQAWELDPKGSTGKLALRLLKRYFPGTMDGVQTP
jgi:tetratricopeptide (TPR) repeat protein